MRTLLLTSAVLVLTTGLAAAQSATTETQNKNAPAMQSSKRDMPMQRQSTMKKNMDKAHPKPVQNSGSSD